MLSSIFSRKKIQAQAVRLPVRGALLLFLLLSLLGGGFFLSHGGRVQAKTAQAQASGNMPIGLNVDFNEQSLVDLIQNDPRFQQLNSTTPLTQDTKGWPTSDFVWVLDNRYTYAWVSGATDIDPLKKSTDLSGTYKLSFSGQATLTAGGDDPAHMATTISNQIYNSATNITTADVTFGNPAGGLLSVIQFTNTKRNPGDAPGTGLTNVRLIRPGYDPTTSQVFTNLWLSSINNYNWSVLRFMDALATNGYASPSSTEVYPYRLQWATDRRMPDTGPLYSNNHAGVRGIPWEYVVLAAQQTHKDIWINIPVNASDDYVAQVANLLKNGNSFTGNQGIPSDVHVYVEYSNEMWHYGFPQGPWNNTAAQDEVNAGGSNLNYDNCNNNGDQWRFRRIAKRTIEIGNQFKQTFGDNGVRIRPVINNGFLSNNVDMLRYVTDNYGPPSQFLYGISQAPYYSSADKSSAQAILAGEKTDSDSHVSNDVLNRTIATFYGLHSLSYEGGEGETYDNNDQDLANQFAASRDAGMQDVEMHDMNNWFSSGNEMFVHFSQVGRYSTYGFWGLSDDLTNQTSGKWQGYLQAMSTPLPAVTAGTALPTTPGQTVTIPETTNPNGDFVQASKAYPWKLLLFRVQQAGTYSLTLQGLQQNAAGRERVLVDNQLAGTTSVSTATYSTSAPVSFSLTPGLHSMFIYQDGPDGLAVQANNVLTVTLQSASGASGWTKCADENGTCSFSGTMVVRYGANGQYAYQTATGSIGCNNGVFGDPIVGTVKSCSVAPVPPTNWTKCADENGTCNVPGAVTVAYGANGQFVYRSVSISVSCTNGTFGDPIVGTFKACYYL